MVTREEAPTPATPKAHTPPSGNRATEKGWAKAGRKEKGGRKDKEKGTSAAKELARDTAREVARQISVSMDGSVDKDSMMALTMGRAVSRTGTRKRGPTTEEADTWVAKANHNATIHHPGRNPCERHNPISVPGRARTVRYGEIPEQPAHPHHEPGLVKQRRNHGTAAVPEP